ncbi:hypothetical protein B0T25DRAFT_165181 [Lasiosphaeria hispida]|uniref:Uncharacterized protein n=1 Tax=Lasiosphaeria hispida TaxID=260671 RepID=A0AAJ0MGC6_9PEZI|nr:hypothetical protein B0T25DRAFT_165181 [Lasiosphaeria hispida]
METINNIANAASKAIWGPDTAHQEPISGKTGDVSKGEPYDAGSMEPDELSTKSTAPDETGTQPVETALPSRPKETCTSTDTADTKSTPPPPNPTAVKDSSALAGDSTKAQNDVRSPSDPDAHHAAAAAKENVDDTEGLDVGDNPDKFAGPGPRPLEEIARENGGNAGAVDASKKSSGVPGQEVEEEEEEEETDKAPLEKHDSGMGNLYVKSSGLRADGGDFDASAPGAGREADRELVPVGFVM